MSIQEWEEEYKQISTDRSGIVIVLGGMDTGKTTFANYLVRRLCEDNRKVSLIDSDVGQSTLGPPTTLGMSAYQSSAELSDKRHPIYLQFAGSTSPTGHMLPIITGLKKLVDKAYGLGVEMIVVDTTGFIHGTAAREFKHGKIELLKPDHLFAIQRSEELEPLLAFYKFGRKPAIHRLSAVPEATLKSEEYRRTYREKKFRDYFLTATELELSLKEVGIWGTWLCKTRRLEVKEIHRVSRVLKTAVVYGEMNHNGIYLIIEGGYTNYEVFQAKRHFAVKHVTISTLTSFENRLVSLNNEEECFALGLIRRLDFKKLSVSLLTPLKNLKGITRIYFGSLKIDPCGKELGKV